MKKTVNACILKKNLPKDYKVCTSPSGLTIYVNHKFNSTDSFDSVNERVYKAINKLNLCENGAGTGFGARDWDFTDLDVEKALISETKAIHDHMKAFFKKWGNEYCSSDKAYDLIERMRTMIQSDEN